MARKWLFVLVALLAMLAVNGLPALAQDEFVFGIVLVGPKNDRGWSQAHYEAGLKIEEEMPGSKMLLFESLNPADNPQTTLLDVATEMAGQGAKVIFTTSDEFEEDTDTVAAALPDVVFINSTGSSALEGKAPANVGNTNAQYEWTRAISGCAAALATQTGSIGYLGPLINFETRRHAAATYLGAKYCYENYRGMASSDLKFTVTWIGFWFNIPGVTLDPTAEANAFFDGGSDVVISGIDTTEALVVAGQRHAEGEAVFAMSQDNPAGCDEATDVCIGGPYYNWFPAYSSIVTAVKDGAWTQSWDWVAPNWDDINDAETSSTSFIVGGALTDEQKTQLDSFIAEMAAYAKDPANADSFFLWQGPLNLQDGSVLVPEGESVTPVTKLADGVSIWYLPQLLEGMTGASTSSN
ncbi:MAG: BMP family ABC transporter substrate-binding protein [Anaerolineae bacterium]